MDKSFWLVWILIVNNSQALKNRVNRYLKPDNSLKIKLFSNLDIEKNFVYYGGDFFNKPIMFLGKSPTKLENRGIPILISRGVKINFFTICFHKGKLGN